MRKGFCQVQDVKMKIEMNNVIVVNNNKQKKT